MIQKPYRVGSILPPLEALNPDGTPFVLNHVAEPGMLLVFIRHITCIACQAHLHRLKKRHAEIEQLGVKVLVVTMTQPPILKLYQESREFPFQFVGDPERKLYADFGLDRIRLRGFFHPRVMWHYTSLVFRGWLALPPKKGEDVFQQGGDFLINSERRLVYAHPCKDPSDHASVRTLIAEMQKLRQPVPV